MSKASIQKVKQKNKVTIEVDDWQIKEIKLVHKEVTGNDWAVIRIAFLSSTLIELIKQRSQKVNGRNAYTIQLNDKNLRYVVVDNTLERFKLKNVAKNRKMTDLTSVFVGFRTREQSKFIKNKFIEAGSEARYSLTYMYLERYNQQTSYQTSQNHQQITATAMSLPPFPRFQSYNAPVTPSNSINALGSGYMDLRSQLDESRLAMQRNNIVRGLANQSMIIPELLLRQIKEIKLVHKEVTGNDWAVIRIAFSSSTLIELIKQRSQKVNGRNAYTIQLNDKNLRYVVVDNTLERFKLKNVAKNRKMTDLTSVFVGFRTREQSKFIKNKFIEAGSEARYSLTYMYLERYNQQTSYQTSQNHQQITATAMSLPPFPRFQSYNAPVTPSNSINALGSGYMDLRSQLDESRLAMQRNNIVRGLANQSMIIPELLLRQIKEIKLVHKEVTGNDWAVIRIAFSSSTLIELIKQRSQKVNGRNAYTIQLNDKNLRYVVVDNTLERFKLKNVAKNRKMTDLVLMGSYDKDFRG
ncbi:unnamed protein product [Chironomus riparius]|uniref:Uncharacterized protein n=1 Tax=Chironomus riparius TaxID=315576 RepID=A0A9N9RWA4_9DIPT|nr:unnamed protein product [Chironomus riparius]